MNPLVWKQTHLDKLGIFGRGNLRNEWSLDVGGVKVNYVKSSILNGELFVKKCLECFRKEDLRDNLFPVGTICINYHKATASILKEPSYLQHNVIAFKPIEGVCDSKFIKYYLEFSGIRSNFRDSISLRKINTVNVERLSNIVFSIPAIRLQQKIGEIIENYDLLLISYEKQISLLKKIRK